MNFTIFLNKYTFLRAGLLRRRPNFYLMHNLSVLLIYDLRSHMLLSSSFIVTFKRTMQLWRLFGPPTAPELGDPNYGVGFAAKPSHWKPATALATPTYELFPMESNLMLGCSKNKIYAAQEIP